MPVAKTSAARLAADAGRAAEDEVARLEQRTAGIVAARPTRRTGCDSPVSVDRSTSTAPSSRRASAEIRSPSDHEEHVAGHELARVDRRPSPVAEDGRLRRQVAPQRLDRALGLPLLHEREERR